MTQENYAQFSPLHAIAYSYASPGAQGCPGQIIIINNKGVLYECFEDDFENDTLKSILPALFDRPHPSWSYFDLGAGNNLWVHKVIYDEFNRKAERYYCGSVLLIFNHWIEIVARIVNNPHNYNRLNEMQNWVTDMRYANLSRGLFDIDSALAYIGANPSDFALANSMFSRPKHSPMHGIGHIYRTMIGCALLGELLQKPREGLLAFCGAYIHDLARVHDGRDPQHGANAANRHFSKFNHLWDKYQLTNKERIYVRWAVEQHCCRQWIQRGEEGYDVMAILKDADALDRCRFRTNNLRPEWLLYKESKHLIPVLESICRRTNTVNEDMSLSNFIKLLD